MYQRGCVDLDFGTLEQLESFPQHDAPKSPLDPRKDEEARTFRFLGGTTIWLDIASSVASGTAPQLFSHHERALRKESQVKLQQVMGCCNQIMFLISRIAALQAQKTQPIDR